MYTLRKRLKRGFSTAGRGGKWQVHKGEMEHSSGNNIIGYPGNYMGVCQERQPSAKSENRIFQECLTVTFAAMLSNILSTFMLCGYIPVPVWVTWAITTIYFILTPLMGLVYYLYAVSVLYEERPQLYRMILLGGIPGAVYTLLVLSNFLQNVCLISLRIRVMNRAA